MTAVVAPRWVPGEGFVGDRAAGVLASPVPAFGIGATVHARIVTAMR
jgi:hypothetical protein